MTAKLTAMIAALIIALAGLTTFLYHNGAAPTTFGATPGGDIQQNDVSIGGVKYRYVQNLLAGTSSIVCNIPTPQATSTLEGFTMTLNGSSGPAFGTQVFDLSTSSSAFASSSPAFMSSVSVTTGAASSSVWIWRPNTATTTGTAVNSAGLGILPGQNGAVPGLSNYLIAPNINLTVRIGTTTPGTFVGYWQGQCQAVFRLSK